MKEKKIIKIIFSFLPGELGTIALLKIKIMQSRKNGADDGERKHLLY